MPSNKQTRRAVLAAGGATALASLSGCVARAFSALDVEREYRRDAPVGDVAGAWPTYQRDFANTGHTTDPGPSADASVERIASGDAALGTSVALADGRGVLGYSDGEGEDGVYRALDLDSETAPAESDDAWTIDYAYGKSTPTLAGDAMFVSTAEFVAAYDARTGERCWRTSEGGYGTPANAPVLAAGTLVDGGGSTVFGRDPATGEERWSYDAGRASPGLVARDGVVYTPIGADGLALGVAALDAATGEERWRREDIPQTGVPFAVGDAHLYYNAHRGNVFALALEDGSTQWRASIPLPENGSPQTAVAGDTLHVQSSRGSLAAFDAADGATNWSLSLDADTFSRPPVVADDTRFVATDDRISAISAASGEELWSKALDARPTGGLSVRGSELYFAGTGRNPGVFRVAD
ncbi:MULTISPECIES: outer membrane protein assembly factor BamB family protein [Haloferax]|uniref:Serine/threonine-protein kinase AfsK n=1 Tax=Haloferax massiliensis TaxID=1476858 RepID=A0A0D6JUA1_9EURY|nr:MULTISPECIES: PQQ-binding-like beta-propeller repeat protein [Haloferax]MDS0241495.1 PQQ-like beta-propeller repeat protein [Haloferax sp. S2CR25]MDS0444616.1 PQQ-like beta-propeller repeat protein [Haloferax sp. S2CR25-2]CQR51985.1 Serine/threonine-protein kinase AfsK [Haloferax massiliensis]